MFTGIVESLGKVVAREGNRLVVAVRKPLVGLKPGESVAVDGVCLTVDRRSDQRIWFHLLPETLRISTLGALRRGDQVNLERPIRLGDRLGGHLTFGHVDGQGTILHRSQKGKSLTLRIQVPERLSPFLVPKGPIAVDGVSFTLGPKIEPDQIRVHLIPLTARQTTLGKKEVGKRVNIEVDLFAKYLRGML